MDGQNLVLILLGVNLLVMILNAVFWVLVSLGDRKLREREKEMYDKFNQVLEEANKKASDLVIGATEKANRMIANTEVMVDDIRVEMRKSFSTAKDKNVDLLEGHLKAMQMENKEFLESLRDNLITDARNLMMDFANQSKQEMEKLVDEVKQQSGVLKQSLDEKINQEFSKVDAEVENYRKQKTELVEKSIGKLLLRVFQLVWPKTVTFEDHEQMVVEALDQAKKEGVFNSNTQKKE